MIIEDLKSWGAGLPSDTLEQLVEALRAEIAVRKKQSNGGAKKQPARMSLRLQYTRCQHPECRCNNGGAGHGPYYYGWVKVKGVVHSFYFGKDKPTQEQINAAIASRRAKA